MCICWAHRKCRITIILITTPGTDRHRAISNNTDSHVASRRLLLRFDHSLTAFLCSVHFVHACEMRRSRVSMCLYVDMRRPSSKFHCAHFPNGRVFISRARSLAGWLWLSFTLFLCLSVFVGIAATEPHDHRAPARTSRPSCVPRRAAKKRAHTCGKRASSTFARACA